MTAMTSEELGITTPAEKAAAARRRDATKRVRWVRDKLTSTSGTPAFDYELLRQFAQNRQSASVAILLLIATVGFLSEPVDRCGARRRLDADGRRNPQHHHGDSAASSSMKPPAA